VATEDIDLTWRLLLAGWHTSYEPNALVGMEVPSTLHSLWIQRRRWARGLGEALHVHARETIRWRHRHLWPLLLEGLASLVWVVLLATFYVAFVAVLLITDGTGPGVDGFVLFFAWGIALCLVSTLQLTFALRLDYPHDRRALFALLVAPIYPVAHWLVAALAALRDELPALFRGPAERRVVWDVPREEVSDVVDQGSGR
jgi:biofilm PGA synthesis N-glycosyltransferase PgaC